MEDVKFNFVINYLNGYNLVAQAYKEDSIIDSIQYIGLTYNEIVDKQLYFYEKNKNK